MTTFPHYSKIKQKYDKASNSPHPTKHSTLFNVFLYCTRLFKLFDQPQNLFKILDLLLTFFMFTLPPHSLSNCPLSLKLFMFSVSAETLLVSYHFSKLLHFVINLLNFSSFLSSYQTLLIFQEVL